MSTAPPKGSPGGRAVLFITGLSGAGKSSALKILEDLGWEVVDNLPMPLISALLSGADTTAGEGAAPIAIGVDSRTRGFAPDAFAALLEKLRRDGTAAPELLFLDCDDEMLQKRFTATRRRHPLAKDRPVGDGIALERRLIRPLRDRADTLIDTTALTLPDLRRELAGRFARDGAALPTITVMSFSFRRGVPREADLVFDVRFLDNPFYDPALRPLCGEDEPVGAHIERDEAWKQFFPRLCDMIDTLIPYYCREGKQYLTVAVGCTGGRHRSVFTACRLSAWLRDNGFRILLSHRDLSRSEQE